jgi:hypothetical protein
MTAAPTLNSRLRVLVAKTFRAEKLYSSIPSSQGEKLTNPSRLSQAANDIRAKEWQRSHYQLRSALNEILSEGSSANMTADIVALRQRFLDRAKESSDAVEQGVESTMDTVARHEFAAVFRFSVDLIKHKARAQASQVIAEELSSVLEASGRNVAVGEQSRSMADERERERALRKAAAAAAKIPSNVIPLKRRFAAGDRFSR